MYAFTYHKPTSARQAATLLMKKEDSKLIAGGHTLLPTMKQRLAGWQGAVSMVMVSVMRCQ